MGLVSVYPEDIPNQNTAAAVLGGIFHSGANIKAWVAEVDRLMNPTASATTYTVLKNTKGQYVARSSSTKGGLQHRSKSVLAGATITGYSDTFNGKPVVYEINTDGVTLYDPKSMQAPKEAAVTVDAKPSMNYRMPLLIIGGVVVLYLLFKK